jgi:hypothetical protein
MNDRSVRGEKDMNTKKQLFLIVLLLGISFSIHPLGWTDAMPEMKGPVITSALAVQQKMQEGNYGSIWKFYVEAKDPDGDMARIAVRVYQAGYGQLTTDWIFLKPQHRNHLKGYLQWNASGLREGAQITLEIFVIDRTGNVSEEASFRLVCTSGCEDQSRPGCLLDQSRLPAPFDRGNILRIGHINIDASFALNQ